MGKQQKEKNDKTIIKQKTDTKQAKEILNMHETTTDASLYKARQRVAFKDLQLSYLLLATLLGGATPFRDTRKLHLSL